MDDVILCDAEGGNAWLRGDHALAVRVDLLNGRAADHPDHHPMMDVMYCMKHYWSYDRWKKYGHAQWGNEVQRSRIAQEGLRRLAELVAIEADYQVSIESGEWLGDRSSYLEEFING